MQYSCYIEVNLICLILQGIIFYRLHQRRAMMSTANKIMKRVLAATAMLCLVDVVAIVSRGRFFPGARIVIEGSNILYLEMMPMISMLWCDYVHVRLNKQRTRVQNILYRLPFVLFTLIALFNPVHHILFTIDAGNLYQRGPGMLIHWIGAWFYFVYAGVISALEIRKTASWAKRNEYKPLLTFLILPAIGCVAQMLLYGVTSVQAGITLSLILVSLQMQDNQVSADELTGINNRMALRMYVDRAVYGAPTTLMVMMIDVNRFKMINDTYGHAVGDIALCDTANILRSVCEQVPQHLFLCRYGGDEFVIIGRDMDQPSMDRVAQLIRQEVSAFVQREQKPFTLDVSIGYTGGSCSDYEDFTHYLRMADESMYEDKKRSKAER